jgi:hypothetical protein
MQFKGYVICLFFIVSSVWVPAVHATARCFTQTGYCIDGKMRTYWESHGGLAVFGLPLGELTQTTVAGVTISTQLFERNQIELHPNNKAPYDVELGLLGNAYLLRTTGVSIAPASAINEVDSAGVAKSSRKDCKWFTTTQQYVCGEFYAYWRQYGIASRQRGPFSIAENTALFGLPITGVYTATLNGNAYQVQVFERARFEYHPENPAPYRVLLGLLGRESLTPAVQETSVVPTATAIPSANADLSASFVVADYLATTGILPESDLRHYRTSLPRFGYWNSNATADIFVIFRDVTYVEQLKGYKALSGMKYLVGTVTVVNNRPIGSAACRIHFNDFSIIDLEGGWTVTDKITTMIDNPFSYKMLEPGQRFGGRVAFMIPSRSAPGQLVAQFSYEQPVTVELRVWPHVN